MKKSIYPTTGLASDLTPLFRPKRAQYVRAKKNDLNCVFCTANRGKIGMRSLCLYKSELSMIILNKYPYNSGHLLILPRRHVATLGELTSFESHDLMESLKIAEALLLKTYKPAGLNIGLNQGAAAGAGIPKHLHFHVIPRWNGDLNFFPLIAKSKVIIEDLDMTYKKLSATLKKLIK